MIVLLIIYLASIIGAYLTIRQLFSEGGEWEVLDPGYTEFVLIVVPGCNTFIGLAGIVGVIIRWIESLNIKIDYSWIFRIKK